MSMAVPVSIAVLAGTSAFSSCSVVQPVALHCTHDSLVIYRYLARCDPRIHDILPCVLGGVRADGDLLWLE